MENEYNLFLKNFICTSTNCKNKSRNITKTTWYFYKNKLNNDNDNIDDNSESYVLSHHSGQLYLYNSKSYNSGTIFVDEWYYKKNNASYKIYNIHDFIDENKVFLENSNENFNDNQKLFEILKEKLGEKYSCTILHYGWCIKSQKINVKFLINKYLSTKNKTIDFKCQMNKEINSEWKQSYIDKNQLISFIDKNLKKLLQKENKNTIPKPILETIPMEIDTINIEIPKLTRKEILQKNKHLFIHKPIEKRIEYQSCIPHNKKEILMAKHFENLKLNN